VKHPVGAVQLSNAIVLAARNGMQNAQGAAQLNFTKEFASYSQLRARYDAEEHTPSPFAGEGWGGVLLNWLLQSTRASPARGLGRTSNRGR